MLSCAYLPSIGKRLHAPVTTIAHLYIVMDPQKRRRGLHRHVLAVKGCPTIDSEGDPLQLVDGLTEELVAEGMATVDMGRMPRQNPSESSGNGGWLARYQHPPRPTGAVGALSRHHCRAICPSL
jgi:hypothetical protein